MTGRKLMSDNEPTPPHTGSNGPFVDKHRVQIRLNVIASELARNGRFVVQSATSTRCFVASHEDIEVKTSGDDPCISVYKGGTFVGNIQPADMVIKTPSSLDRL